MSNIFDISKYKRLARILQIVIRVLFIGSLIAVAASIVLGAVLGFMPASPWSSSIIQSGSLSLTIDNLIMFKVNTPDATIQNLRPVFTCISLMAAVAAVILSIIFRQLDLILGTVKDSRPFAVENSKRLSTIGMTLMAGSFAIKAGEFLVASAIVRALKLYNINVNYSADTLMIIMGFVVLVLAGVFRYGSFLQREYDSTV